MSSIAKQFAAITKTLVAWSDQSPTFAPFFDGSKKSRNGYGVTYTFRDGSKGFVPKGSAKMKPS